MTKMTAEDDDFELDDLDIELTGIAGIHDGTHGVDDGWDADDDIQQLLKDSDERAAIDSTPGSHPSKQYVITSKFGIFRLQAWWVGTQFLWLLLSVVVMPSQVW